MPRSAVPRGMMTAMERISGGDTALRRKQADSKQRITSMVKTESYKENLLESALSMRRKVFVSTPLGSTTVLDRKRLGSAFNKFGLLTITAAARFKTVV